MGILFFVLKKLVIPFNFKINIHYTVVYKYLTFSLYQKSRRDRIIVEFTTICVISAYHH